MPDPFVVSRIQHLPLCQSMTHEEVELLSDVFEVLRLAPDTLVFQQGQPSQGMYIFVYGSAVLLQANASGSTRPVGMVTAGQYINESALFTVASETATLRIVEPAVVLFLPRDGLRTLATQYPKLGADLNEYLREQHRSTPLVKPAPPPPPAPSEVIPSGGAPLVQPAPVRAPVPTPPVQNAPVIQPSAPSNVPLVQPAPQPVVRPVQPVAQPVQPVAPVVQPVVQPVPPVANAPQPVVAPAPVIQTGLPATPIAPPQVTSEGQVIKPAMPAAPVVTAPPVQQSSLPPQVTAAPIMTTLPITFSGQRESEVVVAERWRHWWAFARFAWAPLMMMIGLFILSVVVPVPFLQFAFAVAAVLLPGIALLYLFREWRNDRLIVTSERVIWIERKIIPYSNNVRELPIEGVLEVIADYPAMDPFARLLNYGILRLRTSGSAGDITLDMMPDPRVLQQQIFASRDQYKQVMERQQRNVIRSEVNQLIEGKDPKTAVTHVPPPVYTGFNPLAMRFTNANSETVYRKHWTVWLQHTILPFIMILIGIVIGIVTLTREGDVRLFMMAVSAVPVILGGLWLYWADWDWRNDMYVVGNDRISLIHQRPLWMQNKIDTISLAQVDSVATDQIGLMSALFNRGDVRLSLEGVENVKKFESVSNPRGVAEEISSRQAYARQRQQEAQARQQQQAVADYLSVYHETVNPNPAAGQPYRPPVAQQAAQVPRTTDADRPPKFPRKQ